MSAPLPPRLPLGLFQGYGIEIEYMLVDRASLAVLPVADQVLAALAGEPASEVEVGALAWSNELVLHLLELKTNGPVPVLNGVAQTFQQEVRCFNALLAPRGAMLLPSGMHPLMEPARETRLWPHEYHSIYAAYHRIFNCQAHGWANVQSVHLNLPFHGDEEFGRLHAAIRVLLPIMPALAASSPILEGRVSGRMDTRLDMYLQHTERVPSLTGAVIPEPDFTRRDYERDILDRIYADIAPHDVDGILRHEWLNARGAIARFDRGSIEIRLLDTQEMPAADLAVLTAVVGVLRSMVREEVADFASQQRWEVEPLARLLRGSIAEAEQTVITDRAYLRLFGVCRGTLTAAELWRHLLEASPAEPAPDPEVAQALKVILDQGPLARRLRRAVGPQPERAAIREVYSELAACLAEGRSFLP